MLIRRLAVALVGTLLCSFGFGQDDRYRFYAQDLVGDTGASVTMTFFLDSQPGTNGDPLPVQGWSYGMCHDPLQLALTDLVDGETTLTVKGGNPPDFNAVNDQPNPGTGFTIGVVIDFFGLQQLAPGTAYELNEATYSILASTGTTVPLDFCDTLANPQVQTVVVAGPTFVPVQTSGSISVEENIEPFVLRVGEAVAPSGSDVTLAVTLDNPDAVAGFQIGLANDGSVAVPSAIDPGAALLATNGGQGPGFWSFDLNPELPTGTTAGLLVGALISLEPPFDLLPAGVSADLLTLTYTLPSPIAEDLSTPVDFSDELGQGVETLLIANGEGVNLDERVSGMITSLAVSGPTLIRGDANGDGSVNVADAAVLAQWLFASGPASPCEDVGDVDDDGTLNPLEDLFFLVAYLFQDGPSPAAPFPDCGPDQTADALDCAPSPDGC